MHGGTVIPVQLIVAVAIAATSFGAAWTYQGGRYEAKLAERETDHAVALAGATRDALAKTIALQEKANAAERKHQDRLADLRRDLARTRSTADGLRNDLSAARSALSTASCDSVRQHATTLNSVFGECTVEVERLAGQAQGHAVDTLKLLDAWPTIEPLR